MPPITSQYSINLLNCSLKLILPTIAAHKSINLIYCSFYISQFNQTPCDLGIHHNKVLSIMWHQLIYLKAFYFGTEVNQSLQFHLTTHYASYYTTIFNQSLKLLHKTHSAYCYSTKSIIIIYCSFYISQFNQIPCDLGIDHNSVLSRMWHQSVYLKPCITTHKSINLFNFHSLLILPSVTLH